MRWWWQGGRVEMVEGGGARWWWRGKDELVVGT